MDGMPAGASDLSEAITRMRSMMEKAALSAEDEVWVEGAGRRLGWSLARDALFLIVWSDASCHNHRSPRLRGSDLGSEFYRLCLRPQAYGKLHACRRSKMSVS